MLSFPKDKTNIVPIAFMHCPLYPWNILFLLSLKEPIVFVRHLFTTSHVPCKCTNKILFFCTFSFFFSPEIIILNWNVPKRELWVMRRIRHTWQCGMSYPLVAINSFLPGKRYSLEPHAVFGTMRLEREKNK